MGWTIMYFEGVFKPGWSASKISFPIANKNIWICTLSGWGEWVPLFWTKSLKNGFFWLPSLGPKGKKGGYVRQLGAVEQLVIRVSLAGCPGAPDQPSPWSAPDDGWPIYSWGGQYPNLLSMLILPMTANINIDKCSQESGNLVSSQLFRGAPGWPMWPAPKGITPIMI